MIGALRTPIKIFGAVLSPDGRGGQQKTYVLWGSPYADIRALALAPRGEGRVQSVTRYKAVIRFQKGFPKDARLVWGERTFQIVAADDPDNRHERLHLICDEILEGVS